MHFKRVFAAGLVVTAAFTGGTQAQEGKTSDYAKIASSTVEGYIRPATKTLVTTLSQLEKNTGTVCTTPNAETNAAFSSAFKEAVVALAGVDFLRFGPMGQANIAQRLAFLPDGRGVVRRQVTKITAKSDPTVTDPASLSIKSVALQGLTALERIAYDADGKLILGQSGAQKTFLCEYAESITINLGGTALELEAAWAEPDGFSKTLLQPTKDGGVVQTHKEAAEMIFNGLTTGLIADKDQYLLAVLGKTPKKANPKKAPFARSGNAITYLSASLQGIQSAYLAGNYADQLEGEESWVANSLSFEFSNAQRLLAALPQPLQETGKQPDVRDKLLYLSTIIGGIKDIMAADLAGYLGLAGGFNALDGD
ncbi:imelysin family protein [Pseudovibrio sp. Tun.PSC04-5.I4]|uniref:imelysin family protein n=1 Tax=Pseudovibrio sp. Tun.PSC04-5.I4 TaxID=1798213 RepID=UPI00087E32E7|nr:imelysin family protein [Pseudovibrio sp. Tun.PSC04-5.I4]SDR25133.1 hypothetical protein SAMN04515695_3795 [Pseudovibrio sp. Tun.PSC04-5.I4]